MGMKSVGVGLNPTPTIPLRRYAIVVEYQGGAFAGFQLQKKAYSVQAALEAAIFKRFKEKRRVGATSRTDSGVHAQGQVAVFDLEYDLPATKMVAALNSALPSTVRVLQAKKVPLAWDPRKATRNKTYQYLIHERKIYSPLWEGRAWQIFNKLDLAAMKKAATHLVGKHDFTSFRAAGCEAKHPIRKLESVSIFRRGVLISMRFTADAFLYHMVRNLVGTLVDVGRGKLTPEQVKQILQAKNRKLAGATAPACGLYLEKIRFGKRK